MSTQTFLARTWSRLRTEPGLGRNVTLVALAFITAAAVGGYMLLQANFVPPMGRQVIRAEFSAVPGTNAATSQSVTISGVPVGTITKSEVSDHGTAILELNIEDDYQIFTNARAVLRTINALNEMYVEISPGGPPAEPMSDGGTIPIEQTARPIQADEVLHNLDERSQQAIATLLAESDAALARAPRDLPRGMEATDATLTTLRPVVEKLKTRRKLLARLVSSLSEIAETAGGDQERVARLASSTQKAFGVLAKNDRDLRASLRELPGLSRGLRQALTATQGLTKELDPTLKDLTKASGDLPAALERFTGTIDQLGKTIDVARPVVVAARPVVRDLRPLVAQLDTALGDAIPISRTLDRTTNAVTWYLDDLSAFVFNTSSVFGVKDGQGSFIRAYLTQPLPDGGAVPGQHGADPPRVEDGRIVGDVVPGGN
ncbi:MlaD family protein [Nocardioides sp. GCM10030258]|uniref:MlaD family protein n=1 Tax=unclassified Nocardioides TaxID=2615069 RepID=UPI003615D48C